jgi:crossover junction endodeoxyribonuclease RuvC
VIKIQKKQISHLANGVINTKAGIEHSTRLKQLSQELKKIIKKHQPDQAVVEEIFMYRNTKTVMKVAEARGVILLTIIQNNLPTQEFTPLQVKLSLTGYGRAEKNEMQKKVRSILKLKKMGDDAADGLAVALCYAKTLFET